MYSAAQGEEKERKKNNEKEITRPLGLSVIKQTPFILIHYNFHRNSVFKCALQDVDIVVPTKLASQIYKINLNKNKTTNVVQQLLFTYWYNNNQNLSP